MKKNKILSISLACFVIVILTLILSSCNILNTFFPNNQNNKPDNNTNDDNNSQVSNVINPTVSDYDIEMDGIWNSTILSDIDKYTKTLNKLSLEKVKANIKIIKQANVIVNNHYVTSAGQGSGVIFHEQNEKYATYYFALTNAHVVKLDGESTSHFSKKVKIYDHKGNEYQGNILKYDTSLDLAVVYFIKNKEEPLSVITRRVTNLKKNDLLFAVGQPEGQNNSITSGKIIKYDTVTVENHDHSITTPPFKAVFHSAPINSGSSGGALLDRNLHLAGLNFAGSKDGGQSNAIPIEVINNYLSTEVFTK